MASLQEALAAKLGVAAPALRLEEQAYFDHVVRVTKKRQAVITLMIPKKQVPAGFQVIQPGAPTRVSPKRVEREGRKFSRIDMKSMLEVCSFKSVNIVDYGGMAKVFINLEIDDEHPGFNFWDGYKDFVESLLASTWEKCAVQFDPEKTFVNLSGRRRPGQKDDTEIFFEQEEDSGDDADDTVKVAAIDLMAKAQAEHAEETGEALDSQGRTWSQVLRDEDAVRADTFGV